MKKRWFILIITLILIPIGVFFQTELFVISDIAKIRFQQRSLRSLMVSDESLTEDCLKLINENGSKMAVIYAKGEYRNDKRPPHKIMQFEPDMVSVNSNEIYFTWSIMPQWWWTLTVTKEIFDKESIMNIIKEDEHLKDSTINFKGNGINWYLMEVSL